jgi:hypothetical protein
MTADEFLTSARRTLKRDETNDTTDPDSPAFRMQGGAGDMGTNAISYHTILLHHINNNNGYRTVICQ